jgi:hypothetical protein
MVKYFETKADANCNNQHAKVGEIEFVALPYQGFSARIGRISGRVTDIHTIRDKQTIKQYSAQVHRCLANGESKCLAHMFFSEKDKAFEWAAELMLHYHKNED